MDFLLNDVQLGMLYHTKKKNSIYGIYNSQVIIQWKEQVNYTKLQETWDYLIQTYEVLRSYLKNNSMMIFTDNLRLRINIIHQSDASETEINKTIKKIFSQPIDLYTAPLFDLTLLQISEGLSYLVWTHHHILLSASSVTEIISSMFQHYDDELRFKQQKKIIAYGHYSSKFCEEDKIYWEKLLSGFTESNQIKIAYAQEQYGRSQHTNHMVNTNLHIKPFIQQAECLGVTTNTLFLAAWAMILNRYTMDDDIVFGTVRRQQLDNHHVGMDINTLPIRVIFTENLSIFDLCSSIRQQQIELGKHSNLSLREISKSCFHKKNTNDELFSTFVDYQKLSIHDLLETSVNMKNRHLHVNGRTHYPLNMAAYFEHEILNLKFDYNESLFSHDIIVQVERHYLHVLQALLGKKDRLCSSINVFDDTEKMHYLHTVNDTKKRYVRDVAIHELIQGHVTKDPHHVAIIDGDSVMTYKELDEQSGQIARQLIHHTKPNDVVAIQTHSRLNQIILMLSALKVGCVYLNINPVYPDTTKKLLLEKSNAKVLFVDDTESIGHNAQKIKIISISELKNKAIDQENLPVFRDTKERLAYIIFTSGSTGEPKPVLIKQQAIINLVRDTNYIHINDADVVAQIASPSFDAATFEIWGALLNGATCVIIPKNILLDFDHLGHYLTQYKVTIMLCITSLFNQIAQKKPDVFSSLRCLIVGGETLYTKYVQLVMKACKSSDLSVINAYGPTENTVISTFYTIHKKDKLIAGTVPIGKPISNRKIFVLDAKKRLVPTGIIGELHLAGDGLALEYFKNKKTTNEKFINAYGERVYCTGDYVYLDNANNLHFVGRRDSQVKVNGYRIELSEIKKHLLSHEGIKEVELVIDEIDNRKNIVAFVAFKDVNIPSQELKLYLKKYLPDYMIPSTFIGLVSLPITVNHKVDLTKLKEIQQKSRYYFRKQYTETINEPMILAWEKTFKRKITSQANFFDLGGDSIDALQLIYYASENGFHFQVDDLFKFPNIQDLYHFCTTKKSTKLKLFDHPVRKEHGFFFPTPIQSWFISFGEQHFSEFSQVCQISLQTTILLEDIKKALNKLIQHHDLLRLRFVRSSDGKTAYPYILPAGDCGDSFIHYVENNELHRTDVFSGPIVSVFFNAHSNNSNPSMSIAINHLAVDGVSWRIFVEDLNVLLTHQQDETCLSKKTTSYLEWSEYLFQLAQTDKTLSLASPWIATKGSLNEHNLVDTFDNTASYENTIDKDLIVDLQNTAMSQSFQFSDILLLSFLMALEEMGESTEITIETHGRNIIPDEDISRTIGWFTCLFPFHFKYGISKIHIEDIYKLSKAIIEAKENGYAYGLLQYMSQRKYLEEQTDLIALPFQYFNYLGNLDSHDSGPCAIESINALIDNQFPLYFSLSADLFLKQHQLFFKVTYNKNLYSHDRIERLFSYFRKNLSNINQFFKKESAFPLSPVQSGIYAFCNIHPESESYFVQAICDLKGTINVDKLKRACEQLIQTNDIYRSRFHTAHGVILQSVESEVTTPFQMRDWSRASNGNHNVRIINFLNSDRQTVFHLSKSPLLRFTLIQLSKDTYKFIASFHHIIMDGWSFYLAFKQLLNFYDGINTNFESNTFYSEYIKSLPFVSKTAESKDFWINYLDKESLSTRLNFHKQYETGITYRELPHIKKTVSLSSELINKLRAFSSQYQVTLNAIIQSAFAISLSEHSNQNKVSYAIACSGRGAIQKLNHVIGPVISTLPCAVSIDPSISILEFIQQMQTNIITLQQHEHASSLVISKHLGVEPKELFEYLFVYENYPTSVLFCDAFAVENIEIIERTQYPLTFYVIDDQEIRIQVQYDSHCFASSDLELFLQSFFKQMELMTSHPHTFISTFYMRAIIDTDIDMNKQLIRQHESKSNATDVSILLQQCIQKNNTLTAIIFEDHTLSYDNLFTRVQELQQYLCNNYSSQTVIGILLERSPEYVITILAALYANCIFVPLDVSSPDARLSVMVEQAGIQVIITDSRSIRPDLDVDNIMLDRLDLAELITESKSKAIEYSSQDLAYILFTSGSTGNPKGVTISRGAISAILKSVTELLTLPKSLIVMGISSFIFDISLIDILLPLTRNGTLLVTNTQEQMDAFQQKKYASYYHVNFIQATPTMWKILLDANWQPPKDFILISTGEALPGDLRDTLLSYDCQVWNLYGPTEVTIWATGISLNKSMSKYQPASCIGIPLSGVDCYVMNFQCQPVKPGIVGELYIGGRGLSNGYVNAPELTKKQFINHPDVPGMILYKTADFVRFTPHFGLEYKGRIDTQVKIHGRRIELEEIETILMNEEHVSFAITVVAGELLSKKIVAFICLTDRYLKKTFDVEKLKQNIKTKLPNYMVPSHIQILEEMPLTSTNKVDRKVLLSLTSSLKLKDHVIIEPTNDTQVRLRELWSETLSLSVKNISIDDDYFLLGGNSISAITVSVAIERLFSIYFPIHYIIENPTLSAQSEKIIEQKVKYKTKSVYHEHDILNDLKLPLVPIKTGHKQNIFLIHPIGGTIFRYIPIARYLGERYNVYGIQDPGIEAQSYLFDSLEALSSHYLNVIQAHQPHGPYIIGGASYGGNVSIEIARQLNDKGINEVYILSCDAWAVYPAMANNNRDWFENNIKRQAADLRQMLPSDITLPEVLLDLAWQRQQLIVQYEVQKRPYNLALFKASTLTPVLEPIQEEYNHWRDFCELPINKYEVPGDHESMLNDQNSPILYRSILDYLNKNSLFSE